MINKSLNVVKAIGAFSVILIHCQLYQIDNLGTVLTALCSCAVPLFFLISGYFSYFEENIDSIKKYKTRIIRLIKLLIISNLLYFFLSIINHSYSLSSILNINLKSCLDFIVFNVSPTAGHLWFLQALIYVYILFLAMKKFNIDYRRLYIYIPILLFVNIFIGEVLIGYGIIIDYIFIRNFLFTGIPFFTLGYLIHDKQSLIENKFSNRLLFFIILISIILLIIESLIIGTIGLYLSTIFLSTIIFIWCIKNPCGLNSKIMEWIGWNLYSYIYILHMISIYLLIFLNVNMGYFNLLFAIIITLLISIIAYSINKFFVKYLNFNLV